MEIRYQDLRQARSEPTAFALVVSIPSVTQSCGDSVDGQREEFYLSRLVETKCFLVANLCSSQATTLSF